MFERFTERSREAVSTAQEVAREYGYDQIESTHILIALTRDMECFAARVLDNLNVTEEIIALQNGGVQLAGGTCVLTAPAKKALELALREALSLGHNYIGTEHILLGLTRGTNDAASRLHALGVSTLELRQRTFELLSASLQQRRAPRPKPTSRPKGGIDQFVEYAHQRAQGQMREREWRKAAEYAKHAEQLRDRLEDINRAIADLDRVLAELWDGQEAGVVTALAAYEEASRALAACAIATPEREAQRQRDVG